MNKHKQFEATAASIQLCDTCERAYAQFIPFTICHLVQLFIE